MKFSAILFASFATYVSVSAAPQRKKGAAKGNAAAVTGAAGATAGAAAVAGTVTRGASTIVMKEVGGIAGNECLTFRNNGKHPPFTKNFLTLHQQPHTSEKQTNIQLR